MIFGNSFLTAHTVCKIQTMDFMHLILFFVEKNHIHTDYNRAILNIDSFLIGF